MSGKPNNKWLETMIAKHGSREAVREFQQRAGKKGGKAKVPKGFAMDREKAQTAGAKGGKVSKMIQDIKPYTGLQLAYERDIVPRVLELAEMQANRSGGTTKIEVKDHHQHYFEDQHGRYTTFGECSCGRTFYKSMATGEWWGM